jgi:2-haloacid dehalogenase
MPQLTLPGTSEAHPIEACVFDAYGTLLDVHSALASVLQARAGQAGPAIDDARAKSLSILWRDKQLAYSWLRSLMRHHADFASVTADALDFALSVHGLDGDPTLRAELLAAYDKLAPYPEVPGVLARLAEGGLPLAVLSNGTPAMLDAGLAHAGIAGSFTAILSIEEIGVFKPAPEVYSLATRHLGLAAPKILFLSSNGWDVHGAAAFGFTTIHVDRQASPPERLPGRPVHRLADLAPLPGLLGL